eukprot:CAMPEP_0168339592 /NCGR_PEP_ID=MMETSP0213-20121227/13549_1 /TAXON_ID=151035 /ORGANISM="Euplotes harpa, Strain FSP1.4" /LENGTH=180 /DNA_ID=CAMNT_0008345645 /DNA_START=1687 /DNA_END=2229 /DNA_ORIENTATION=-
MKDAYHIAIRDDTLDVSLFQPLTEDVPDVIGRVSVLPQVLDVNAFLFFFKRRDRLGELAQDMFFVRVHPSHLVITQLLVEQVVFPQLFREFSRQLRNAVCDQDNTKVVLVIALLHLFIIVDYLDDASHTAGEGLDELREVLLVHRYAKHHQRSIFFCTLCFVSPFDMSLIKLGGSGHSDF